MANRTVIIKDNRASDDDTSLWIILLIAFAVAMIAFVGYRNWPTSHSAPAPSATLAQQSAPATN